MIINPQIVNPRSPPSSPEEMENPAAVPSLSSCHSCGNSSTRSELQFLDSRWRIVPLCPRCLTLIRSAAACSYCFSNFSSSDGRLLCPDCSRSIHIYCAPLYRGHITVFNLHSDSFACIDCRPILKPGNQPSNMNSSVSVEDLARHARAAAEKKAAAASWAREKAQQKAAVADQAESRAKKLLGVITRGKPRPVENNHVQITPDEQLALQLHLDINGSRRITRSRAAQAQFSHGGNSKSVCLKVTKVGFSTEDMSLFDSEQMMVIDGPSALESKRTTEHEKGIDGCRMDADGKGINGFSRSTLVESPLKEGQGSCHLSSEIEMELDKQDGYRESHIVDASVNFSCDRSSSSITLNGTNKDQKNVNNGRNLVAVPVKERQHEIDGYRDIDLGENLDRKNEREGHIESNLVEKVPVYDDHRSCDQSSSTVTLDGIEKLGKMVTIGTSNLLEVPVGEQGYRSNNLVGKELKDKINGHTESNLIDVHVNEDSKICDQSSSSINSDCAEDQQNVTNEHTDSNLLEVVVKEQGLRFTGVSSAELYSNDMEYQMGTNGCIDSNFVVIPAEEQVRGCNDIGSVSVSYQRVHELNDILFLSELRVCALKGSVESQLKRCGVPDRYMKKYSRRHLSSKGTRDEKESQLAQPMKKYSRRHPSLKGIKDGKQSQLV